MTSIHRLRTSLLAALAAAGFVAVNVAGCGSSCPTNGLATPPPADATYCLTLEELDVARLCTTDTKACADPLTECPAYQDTGPLCRTATAGPWVVDCKCCYVVPPVQPACGRPFVIGGEAVRAAAAARGDWCEGDANGASAPDAGDYERAEVALGWLDDARMEHASIASFARFTLQLLALGAPPELVEDAQRASLDEIAHARACFALASRHAGEALGPGPLPLEGAFPALTLAEAAAAAVTEGCVGETLAALVAAEQLRVAVDAQAREALEKIAADEARHAELAYRFVAWAVASGGAPVRAAVARAFGAAITGDDAALTERDAGRTRYLHQHGRLRLHEIARVQRAALRDVVEPCARALAAAPPECGARGATADALSMI